MRSIAQLCRIFCTGFSIQRYGIAAAGAAVMLGTGLALLSPPAGAMVFSFGIVLLGSSVLVPAGWVAREVSLPRAYRFAPHFRKKMLAALLLVAAAPSVPTGIVAALAPGDAAILPAVVLPALLTSAMIWVFFFLPASMLAPLGAIVVIGLLRRANPEAIPAIEELGPEVAACVLIAAWAAFAAWYLRAPRIGPFHSRLLLRLDRLFAREARLPDVVPVETSLRAHLWPQFRPNETWTSAIGGGLLCAIIAAILIRGEAQSRAMVALACLIAAALAFQPGWAAARNARLVWLRAPLSRIELFRTAEAGFLRLLAIRALMLAIGFTGAFVLRNMPLAPLLPLLAVAASSAVLAAYIGLGMVRFEPWRDVALVGAYVASLGYGAWALGRGESLGVLLLVSGHTAAAVLCRTIAVRRWREIDWIETRPPRRDATETLVKLLQGES